MRAQLLQFLTALFRWLRSIYSEDDGSGSSTRVAVAALVAFILGVGISFAFHVWHRSVTIEQFDAFLGAGATFIVTTCGALYGINRLADYGNNRLGSAVPATPAGPTAPISTPEAPDAH